MSKAERLALQSASAEFQLFSLRPSYAIRSMFGVLAVGEPNAPMSLYPRLSARRMIMLGDVDLEDRARVGYVARKKHINDRSCNLKFVTDFVPVGKGKQK